MGVGHGQVEKTALVEVGRDDVRGALSHWIRDRLAKGILGRLLFLAGGKDNTNEKDKQKSTSHAAIVRGFVCVSIVHLGMKSRLKKKAGRVRLAA